MIKNKRQNALTRVELLVVITGVVFLYLIITPPLGKAKESAKAAICKANLNIYGAAMARYLADNEDTYPESMHTLVNRDVYGPDLPVIPLSCQWHDERINPEVNPEFAGHLWPYLQTMKSCLCPTFKRFALKYGKYHPSHDSNIPINPQYSYSQNIFLGRLHPDGTYLGVGKESEVINPGNTLMFTEETIWQIPDLVYYTLNDTCFFPRHPNGNLSSNPIMNLGDCVATYHKTSIDAKDYGVGNAVFVDGHVRFIDPRDSVKTDWGEISGSFRYAWPLKGTFDQECPY